MPRIGTVARQEYEERRKKDRRTPEYRKTVNDRRRKKYAEDAEYRKSHLAYQKAYRTQGPVNLLTRATRIARGMIWTPEQEQAHLGKMHCEVCGNEPPPSRGMFADHCHRCRHYRGALCPGCNHALGIIEKWQATCPEGSPMRAYADRHACPAELRGEDLGPGAQDQLPGTGRDSRRCRRPVPQAGRVWVVAAVCKGPVHLRFSCRRTLR